MAITPKIIVANPGGSTSITDGAVTFPIAEGSYTIHTTRDGVKCVVAPNGIIINEPSPAFTNNAGRLMNGAMLNAERTLTMQQAFDNAGGGADTYVSGKQVTFPITLRPGDALIKGKSTTTVTSQGRTGLLDQFAGLHVVASAPPANAFAAPFIWPASDKANRPWRTVDVDARLSELPSLSASGMQTLTWAQIAQFWDKMELGQAMTPATTFGAYEYITLKNFSGTDIDNYDRQQHVVFNAVFMGLLLNEWSTADKTAALIRMLQHGCQRGEAMVKGGLVLEPYADGGHHRSQYGCAMTWLWATGRQDQYATWLPLVGGSVSGQVVKLDAAFLANCAIHSDLSKPFPWRRRPIISVTGSTPGQPATIIVEGYREAGTSRGDGPRPELRGLNITRESDSASAYTLSSDGGGSNDYSEITITIAAQPSTPFAAGNTVYFPPPFSLVQDTCDFTLSPIATFPNYYNPSQFADYRDLGKDMITHLWCHAIGMHGSQMANALSYCLRTMEANTPAGHDYPAHVDVNAPGLTGRGPSNEAWQEQFYNSHASYLLALPQDV